LLGKQINHGGIVTDRSSTVRSRDLGQQLAAVRQAAGHTTITLAQAIGTGAPTLSRLENGVRGISDVKLIQYLAHCGLKSDEIVPYVQLAHAPDTGYHLSAFDGRVVDELMALVVHETTASAIEQYETTLVPGLLQSEDYARALFHETAFEADDLIERWVEVRMDRQASLRRVQPPRTTFYLTEHALRSVVGGPAVMHDQLMKLWFACSWDNCSIRVVPATKIGKGGQICSFRLMSFAGHDPVVQHDVLAASLFLEKPEDIALYRGAINRIDRVALSAGQSQALISALADEYGAQHERETDLAQE
jgi:transcriptional regulator with XRE-family HTH domain